MEMDRALNTVLISGNNGSYHQLSAGVERSFCCLKSYTHNTMGHGGLSSLALLAIERTVIKSLEKRASWYDRVTEPFLEKEQNLHINTFTIYMM